MVTLLAPPPLELLFEDDELPLEDDEEPLESELDDVADGSPLEVDVVVVVGVDATAADELLADDFLASAGSCPETSTSVIMSQAATNNASEPAMMRRRIVRARAARALRSA